jgi:tetratricopeptide (TPR) repeat protein
VIFVSFDTIKKYWQEANQLTAGLQPNDDFSTPELVTYFNDHLPSGNKMTKTKVNYLREQGILRPKDSGGEIRTSWRYTPDDVRRVLLVELLKTQAHLSIQEIKGWLLSFFEENLNSEYLDVQTPHSAIQESPTIPPPTSVNSAYALLHNRTLGTLITALGFGDAEMTPPGCLISIRILSQAVEKPYHNKLAWDQAQTLLERDAWTFAVSDAYFKLYVYTDFIKLQNSRPAIASMFPEYYWYLVTLQDTTGQLYQVVLGLPKSIVQQASILAIDESLEKRIQHNIPIQLEEFPGLSTLLRAAFINPLSIMKGTNLAVLIEIIAAASDAWDYCAVLVPEPSAEGFAKWLRLLEYSSRFPSQLKGKGVEIGKPLSGWCYYYQQGVFVESTAENDPRIAFYEEEGRPVAAAGIPAIAEDQRVVGVIYVARHARSGEKHLVFTDEVRASLKAFGYICGDMIARDQIEIETVRSMGRMSIHPLYPVTNSFLSLESMLQCIANEVQRGVSPEKAAVSWIYLLTLNIQATSKDAISQWLCEQGINLTGNFLANHLWDPPHHDPLPIGLCKISSEQYVFAILQTVDLAEAQYKERITHLQQEMKKMRIGRLSPDFYPSAITFRYEDLRKHFDGNEMMGMVADLMERILERLTAGPYFKRGHEALYTNDLDRAVSEFEDALRYVTNSWYGYKHLAEARMLQGTNSAIEEAIEKCQLALKLNAQYASAHCLLADCYSYQGRFGEAIIEYERALQIENARHDFLTRYGLSLAGMTSTEYQNALQYLQKEQPDLVQRTYLDQPWLEAIDKFDRVRKLRLPNDTFEEQRARRANYHYYRGYSYLQADLIDKSVEDFAVGRKLAPDNLQLIQAYSYALSLRRRKENDAKSIDRS